MLNKVIIEGIVTHNSWGKNKESGGYFLTLKQERSFNKFKRVNYFNAFANQPLAKKLAILLDNNKNCKLIIEGKLRTFLSKSDKTYHTTILIEKIINSTTESNTTNNKIQNN